MDAVKFGSAQPLPGEAHLTIEYEVRKIDLFAAHMTTMIRNRVLLCIVVLAPVLPVWTALSSASKVVPAVGTIVAGVLLYLVALSFFLVFQTLMALATIAFRKYHGVVGRHTLQITDEGLVERTDINEGISNWAGLHKVISGPKYLYIYVTEGNYHIIPKRYFTSHGIEGFAHEIRRRMAQERAAAP